MSIYIDEVRGSIRVASAPVTDLIDWISPSSYSVDGKVLTIYLRMKFTRVMSPSWERMGIISSMNGVS